MSDSKPIVALFSCVKQVESADRETYIRPVDGSSRYNYKILKKNRKSSLKKKPLHRVFVFFLFIFVVVLV